MFQTVTGRPAPAEFPCRAHIVYYTAGRRRLAPEKACFLQDRLPEAVVGFAGVTEELMMRASTFLLPLLALATTGAGLPAQSQEGARIRPWPKNPWYWSYDGKPVLLVGGTDDDNLFQWPDERLREQLDRLVACGGNYIRNTMSDRPDRGFEVYPFKRREDGRYDLRAWNEEYWRRFERLLKWTSERRIIVQIEIWDRFDYTDHRGRNYWQRHPYHPDNNVNYDARSSGFARKYPDHPGSNRQPFFFTTPDQKDNRVVFPFQRAFVDKLLSISLRYGHVLYCIDNETSGDEAWSRYWAKYIRNKAKQAGVEVFITEMWDDWNVTGGRHMRTYDHPDLYDYVDISQNNHNRGDRHWRNLQRVRRYLAKQPRPINTVKTYGADGNKFGHTDNDGLERFWRHLLGGCASARFHRPPAGLGLGPKAQAAIRAVREVEKLVPFWTLKPATKRLGERKPNEAYLASAGDAAHVVYFPKRGEVEIALRGKNWGIWWFRCDKSVRTEPSLLQGGGSVRLRAPGEGHWVGVLVRDKADEADAR